MICPLLSCLVVLVRQCRKLWLFRSCSSSLAVFVPQTPIPMVLSAQQIMEIPQLLLILVVDVPVAGSCRFSGAAVEKPLALPQLQLVEKSVTFSVPLYLTVTCTVFAFEVQDSGLFWEMTSGCFPYSALFGSTLDTCTASVYGALDMYNAGFAGDNAPLAVFLGLHHDARHHGRYGPEGQSRYGAHGQTAENCGISAVAVLPGRRHLFRGAEAVSHGPDSLSDHRCSPVAVQGSTSLLCIIVQIFLSWCRCRFPLIVVPVVQVERDLLVPSWRRLSCSHGCTPVVFFVWGSSSSR